MQKEDIKILVVEDDMNLGAAIKETVNRAGYRAIHVAKPDDALSMVRMQAIHAAIIDCMLPKMNGRDLAVKLKEEVSSELPIVLTSGIYKDKAFSRDALQTTGAVAFLQKPFEVKELIDTLDKKLSHLIDMPIPPLHDILSKVKPSAKERIRIINEAEQVHGFDLPWIFSLLLDPKVNGHLNIINADGEVAGVGFQNGHIVQVNLKDTQSYFGVLLVEKGFISTSELEAVMAATGKTKRVGERLVESNVLSPHAIQIVVAEQQAIRLSKTISETSVKVNFIESTDIREDAQLDRGALCELLDDWASSKITLEWLKAFYMPWMRHTIVKGVEYSETHRCLTLPVLSRLPGFLKKVTSGQTLDQVLSMHHDEDLLYRAVHVLLLARLICFGDQHSAVDFEAQRRRLKKIDETLAHQNHFERLGLSQKSKDSEIKRSYHELAKALHPDKLGPETPVDIRELTRSAFSKISTAYEVLSDPSRRDTYMKELEQGRAEQILQAESLTETGKNFLNKGDVKKAHTLFEQAATLAPPHVELKLLLMWTRLKTAGQNKDVIEHIKNALSQIPPEDRHSPIFYFVKGLFMMNTGEEDAARKSFEHAISIDPDFISARRELNLLKMQKKDAKSTDLLRGDLKDVIGHFFKKK